MERHHAESIQRLCAELEPDPSILALVLGGSIAHGFARSDSDIDVTIVVGTEEYEARQREGRLVYNNRALCTYEKGYIDGKYVDVAFLREVAARGSEPARYAYEGSRILFCRIEGLQELLASIVRYPAAEKSERIERFIAQLLAWRWYYSEGARQQNRYLMNLALQKVVLFSTRIVLADNELLFPYHKWMLRVLQGAKRRPPGMDADIEALLTRDSWQRVDAYCRGILEFVGKDFAAADGAWPARFMRDTELRWVTQEAAVDDI